jgi:hypothetical protein
MKRLLTTAAALALSITAAQACAPAPMCWIAEGPAYLRDICRGINKGDNDLSKVEEPEKFPALSKACKKVGVALKVQQPTVGADGIPLRFLGHGAPCPKDYSPDPFNHGECRLESSFKAY